MIPSEPAARGALRAALLAASAAALVLAACSGDGGGAGPAPGSACTADVSHACACGGGYGTRSCDAGVWTACDCSAPAVCSPDGAALSGAGVLHTTIADVVLTDTPASVETFFKQDVDAIDAGCVGRTVVKIGGERGCRIELEFGAAVAGTGGLLKATFVADSFCPGFTDVNEGTWTSASGYGPWWTGPRSAPSPASADAYCAPGARLTFPDRAIAVTRTAPAGGIETIRVNLKDVAVAGDVVMTGDPSPGFQCVAPGCASGMHDDGTGWCVAPTACAPGYHDGGDRACTAVGTCSDGYHDDGTGTCVVAGCAAGFHDGGDGRCVLLASCSPGYHDAGLGACAAGTTCEPGFRWDGALSLCTAWTGAGYPVDPGRDSPFAAALEGGGVLYGGGYDFSGCLATAEVWDPATSTWTATGSMATPRCGALAVTLADGRVLVAGGNTTGGEYVQDAEVYDPATGAFAAAGKMNEARTYFTLTRVAGGKVVARGGSASPMTAESWDPATGVWTPTTGAPTASRVGHTATALLDGRLLVAGGYQYSGSLDSAEIYDPASDRWTATGAMAAGRYYHAAVRLDDGSVVVFGGDAGSTATAERWTPGEGAWRAAGTLLASPYRDCAALLPSGKVLVLENAGSVNELFDPASATFSPTGRTLEGMSWVQAVALTSGHVMALAPWTYAEIYDGPQ